MAVKLGVFVEPFDLYKSISVGLATHQTEPPRYGLFQVGSVIGVLLDTDRGAISFYKDGNDLGLAFLSHDLQEGEFLPFVRTQCRCKLSLFSPK